jgi:hypothetical protein
MYQQLILIYWKSRVSSTKFGLKHAPTKTGAQAALETMMSSNARNHPYAGMWVTADGYIRQELLPNGRYDEARGNKTSAYQGRYEIIGNQIKYWDDTGFEADGEFIGDILHHVGMKFFRERPAT